MTAAIDTPLRESDLARQASPRLWTLTLLVVGLFTLGRFVMAAVIDLRTDEAYYWTWSEEWVASYLDHPPMVAWFIRAGTALFGDTSFGARFTHLLAMALTELIFADIVRRRTGSVPAALIFVLALESTLNFGVTSAFLEPSIPMILFAGALFWTLTRLEETGDARWWLAAGLFGGLALLSKYTMLFFVPALLAYVLVPRGNRRWLLSPWLWGGVLLALVVVSPVLWWNAVNEWASFRFQGVRAGTVPPVNWDTSSTYFLVTLVFNGPVLVVVTLWGAVVALWRYRGGSDPIALMLAVGFLAPSLYLAERALHLFINPSWAIQIWPLGFAALAIVGADLRRNGWPRLERFALVGTLTGLVIPATMLFHATLGTGVYFGVRDPYGADAGFDTAAERVLEVAQEHGATWIAASTYHTYATMRWELRGRMPVVQVTERSRFLGWAQPDPSIFQGPGLYVYRDAPDPRISEVAGEVVRPLGEVDRIWRGAVMGTLKIGLIEGWTPPLNPPRDSVLYRWPNLV